MWPAGAAVPHAAREPGLGRDPAHGLKGKGCGCAVVDLQVRVAPLVARDKYWQRHLSKGSGHSPVLEIHFPTVSRTSVGRGRWGAGRLGDAGDLQGRAASEERVSYAVFDHLWCSQILHSPALDTDGVSLAVLCEGSIFHGARASCLFEVDQPVDDTLDPLCLFWH